MLENLFSEVKIGNKTIKNRAVVPAMVMNFCNEDGTCTNQFKAYHARRAKGGFGMIITEDFAVSPEGKGFPYLPGLWNDNQIDGFKDFTDTIHQYGTTIIAQIYHAGRQTNSAITGQAPWAPSALPDPFSPDMPHEMIINEIKWTIQNFADAAYRAKLAGFDGVEIHGAHGYLIAQFMSSYSNKRTDEYGGSLDNRMRFALEIIKKVREKCGDDFIVGYRISADEHVTGGRTIEDTKAIIPYLEAAGISYVHVSAGVYRSFDAIMPSQYCQHAWIADSAKEIKSITNLPVISVGRYNDMRLADSVIKSKKADMVSFGRQSLADPETPNKSKEGRFEDIRTCIACHHGCVGQLLQNKPGRCILNPELGYESQTNIIQTSNPKNIMIIGAGPGGLAAAISLAQSGHHISVYEKRRWAGGQFRIGAVPPGKGEIINFINYQITQLKHLGVDIHFNIEVNLSLIEEKNPDIIITATGAKPMIPPIPGVQSKCVVTSHDVLEGLVNTGSNIVVIGGGCVGAETANYLASNLKSVTLVEMREDIALDEALVPRWGLLAELEKNKVRICTQTSVKEITENSVVLKGKVDETIKVDTVVLATGAVSDNTLYNDLIKKGYNVKIIGDALQPGLAGTAIRQGYELAKELK